MNKLLIITGPTATGKTTLGIQMAKKYNGEIISADSRQVYMGRDIETGKDRSFPQWGIDIASPNEKFNVSAFVAYARDKIKDISDRGKLPIIVGGTGLYIKELLNPSPTLGIAPNEKLREKLSLLTTVQLQTELKQINLAKWITMNMSDQNNPRRLIRAIEISSLKNIPSQNNDSLRSFPKSILTIVLFSSKKTLFEKISARRKVRPDLIPFEFRLAKRQLTYLKKYFSSALWFDVGEIDYSHKILQLTDKWLAPLKL